MKAGAATPAFSRFVWDKRSLPKQSANIGIDTKVPIRKNFGIHLHNLSDDQTIGGRLRLLRKELGLTQQEIADRIEFSAKGWQKIEQDKAIPGGETLLKLEALGYNPGWLLTGHGARRMETVRAQMDAVPLAVDAELMERLHDRVAAIFHEVGQKPPQRRIAREAANLYNELVKSVPDISDHDMVEVTLPRLALDFKRRIAQAEPGAGKRSA